MHRLRSPWAVGLVVGIVTIAGCGDGLRRVPVQGKLTAAGAPVVGATVQFLPEGDTKGEGGIGTSDTSGAFTLIGSRNDDTGVVPGKYKVRVTRMMDKNGTILPSDAKQADFPDADESVPAPYSTQGSPLVVAVPDAGGAVSVEIPVKLRGKVKH